MTIAIGSILPVGTIIHSMLTTTQFTTEYGDNWVLMDGRSVTGSKYASVTGNTTIPDATGRFLRGKGANNPDGDLSVGTYTADKYTSHSHADTGSFDVYQNTNNSGGNFVASTTNSRGVRYTQSVTMTPSASGGNETAPKNITVNIFIRIN